MSDFAKLLKNRLNIENEAGTGAALEARSNRKSIS
jgi:hypothetical protein